MSKHALSAAERVLAAFRTGAVVKAAELIFVERALAPDAPCRRWTFFNRFCAALSGSVDARTFQQWLEAKRPVRKGEKATGFIFLPVFPRRSAKEAGPDEVVEAEEASTQPVNFLVKAVFGYHQTEGEPIPAYEERERFLSELPLIDVARAWGVPVTVRRELLQLGMLGALRHEEESPEAAIDLAVTNPEVFLHELCHAAEKRLGTLTAGDADRPGKEIVAEFGAQILCAVLGRPTATDWSYQYLEQYATELGVDVEKAVLRFLERTLAAVELILKTAGELEGGSRLDNVPEQLAA